MSTYSKRFKRDVAKMTADFHNQLKIIEQKAHTNIEEAKREYTNETIKFQISIKQDKHIIIQFIINPAKYPFTPPIVLVNGIYYLNLLTTINSLSNKSLSYCEKKFNLPNCVHCSSIVCERKWTPFYKLTNVLKEIYNNCEIILRMKEMNCGKKIMTYFGCDPHLLNDYF